ncbi:MAG: TAT-variant-translocated molybdopterin oxidoreductase [Calditrichaceae bacterium]|nr:TAT-variant-translocated molybdopterin oxidoreductase [Calditrichaceae bacterium]
MKDKNKLNGKDYWRSLDQLADTPEFREFLHREFPENASELSSAVSRRKFLTLMGASLAFAGLAGCRRPVEKIIPYVNAPENVTPGIPKYYATTMPFGLSAYGLLVESHEGRPTKIEGNELHPSTLGKSNILTQAAILGLYDPDRSNSPLQNGNSKSWDDFIAYWRSEREQFSDNRGQGLAVISESFASPTLYRLYTDFKKNYPRAKWFTYEPLSDENIYSGSQLATGKNYQPVYDYAKAKVILSLDSDFLLTENENITANRGFAAGRKLETEKDSMNRLYVVENNFSITGGMADHRLRLPTSKIIDFCTALMNELGIHMGKPDLSSIDKKWLQEVAADLKKNKGNSLVVAGKKQPTVVHAMVMAINNVLGNAGNSVTYIELKDAVLPRTESIRDLKTSVQDKEINTLIILDGNPVFNAPADLEFTHILKKIEKTVHLSLYQDETSQLVNWHLPLAHFLESWGDARSLNGTVSVMQPLIEPLFGGRSMAEVLNLLINGEDLRGYEIVRSTWKSILKSGDFEFNWTKVLHDGLFANSQPIKEIPKISAAKIELYLSKNHRPEKLSAENIEVVFQQSPAVYDGRFANNGWLQEMPDPVTKLSWDNTALISPNTAKELNLKNEDLIKIDYKGRSVEAPIWIMPGHADYSITLTLGYGRKSVGRIGNYVGYDAYKIRPAMNLYFGVGAVITKTGKTYLLANTQDHGSMEGRPLVREASIEEYKKHPEFAKEMVGHPPLKSLWEEQSYDEGYQWGMTIDLNACSGCNACVIACQSENNIPIVGKEQVRKGREMHWIRLDRYFSGGLSEPEMVYQPVACQHCENAPCEQVCPVAATVHDEEGLNVMAYNRCIGTRYCSNNCPYKVRRFNFFNYTNEYPEVLKMAQNPDVTVRSRGVMEKCTFCTQRINSVKITAKNKGETVKDGDVVTACQQSCPADAIVFGNINDPKSAVSKMKELNREYTMLGELNVKTRTTYLAKVRNPNPALMD